MELFPFAILNQICVPKKKRYLVSRCTLGFCSDESCEMCDASILAVTCPYIAFSLFQSHLYFFYLVLSIYLFMFACFGFAHCWEQYLYTLTGKVCLKRLICDMLFQYSGRSHSISIGLIPSK